MTIIVFTENRLIQIRYKGLLKRFGTIDIDRMLFTDEKIFTVEEATNKQNDRILSRNTQSIPESAKVVDRTHHPLSVMQGRSQDF